MQTNFPSTVIYLAEHVGGGDPFDTPDVSSRADWYGISGTPTVQVDGKYQSVGGGNGCTAEYNIYHNYYNNRMTETAGVSPVAINGYVSAYGATGSMQATFQLQDAASLGSIQASLILYEDNITWCCGIDGASQWGSIVRLIRNQPVTLVNVGDTATLVQEFNVDPSWNIANLHAVAVLQQTGSPKTIVQAGRLTNVIDFALSVPRRITSILYGNGAATFTGTVQNVSGAPDMLTLSVDQSMGWPTDFQVAGDPNWYTSHAFAFDPNSSKDVTVRVRTDGVKRIGAGTLTVQSGNSGRAEPAALRVFNGSVSILFVDNDGGQSYQGVPYETPFLHAMNGIGYLFDDWDVYNVYNGATPVTSDMIGYDVVMWETGYNTATPVSQTDMTSLEQYLDSGGHLYLNSMDFLSTANIPPVFTTNYLGVTSWVPNTRAHTDTGVAGDPVTDGMVLPLTFPAENANKVDTTNPTADATAIFFSETNNPNAVRHQAGNFRVVFSTIIENAISESAPAPNNNQTLIQRVVEWLTQTGVSSVPVTATLPKGGFLTAQPNPSRAGVDLDFALGAGSSRVRLTLLDASGRLVRTLLEGNASAGPHHLRWDGRDDGGRPAASGIYFARLQSPDGERSEKLIVIK